MMKKRKLGIIGGSGLYKMEGFEKTKWKKIKTPWGKPSDEILIAKLGGKKFVLYQDILEDIKLILLI
jgi:5'-methylthioadenosine phosphorylase